ncbi:hypothetical protein AWB68_08143 [Caballeronia choica]|uniref:Uncharacterized protein n=1 Tax=Caballeronia choica TaxID=326476 RepID=A0A158L066_9BURK|nr:hypothetical protein AWB68_08143 [Caballeronia choica]
MAAEPLNFPLLQEAQQAGLAFERQIADFVQEQCAAVGRFHPADLALIGAGERPAFITEQLRLQQMGGNRTAIDRDERLAAPHRLFVNRHRGQFLAGARFARDEHRRVGHRDLADRAEQREHRVARADHLALGAASAPIFRLRIVQRHHAIRMADGVHNAIARGRQRDVVEAKITNQPAQVRLHDLVGMTGRDPADRRDRQHRLDRGQVARKLTVGEIEDAGGRLVEPSCALKALARVDLFDIPMAIFETRMQIAIECASHVIQFPDFPEHIVLSFALVMGEQYAFAPMTAKCTANVSPTLIV